jgi:RHS repeat-associated protein
MYVHQPSGYYLSATRAYSPNLGRWITKDPIQEKGGLNMYAYCGNDPINNVDPEGLDIKVIDSSNNATYFPNASAFKTWLSTAPNNSIDTIIWNGHSDAILAGTDTDDQSDPDGIQVYRDPQGNFSVRLQDSHFNNLGNIADLLKDKFDPNGSKLINLAGCHTGGSPGAAGFAGSPNVAQQLSADLKNNIKVMGSSGPTNPGLPIPGTYGGAFSPFGDNIYINGKLQ